MEMSSPVTPLSSIAAFAATTPKSVAVNFLRAPLKVPKGVRLADKNTMPGKFSLTLFFPILRICLEEPVLKAF